MSGFEDMDEQENTLPPVKYFCHRCCMHVDMNLDTNTCARCHDGFIEKVEDINTDGDFEDIEGNDIEHDHNVDAANLTPQRARGARRSDHGTTTYRMPILNDTTRLRRLHRQPRGQEQDLTQNILNLMTPTANMAFSQTAVNTNHPNFVNMMQGLYTLLNSDGNVVSDVVIRLLTSPNSMQPQTGQAFINRLSHTPFTSDHKEKCADCPICIDTFKDEEDVVILSCDHFFHSECIINWLKLRNTCPVCRTVLE